jgi:hypothetical protein
MVHSCLLWYLWMEMNNRSFEDRERVLEEIKSFFFSFGDYFSRFYSSLCS